MVYRIVYRRTIAQDVPDNELRGEAPEEALRYFDERDLDDWASAVLEVKNDSHEKAEFQVVGNIMSFHNEPDARVVSEGNLYTFRKNVLRNLLEHGIPWGRVKIYALKTEQACTKE